MELNCAAPGIAFKELICCIAIMIIDNAVNLIIDNGVSKGSWSNCDVAHKSCPFRFINTEIVAVLRGEVTDNVSLILGVTCTANGVDYTNNAFGA